MLGNRSITKYSSVQFWLSVLVNNAILIPMSLHKEDKKTVKAVHEKVFQLPLETNDNRVVYRVAKIKSKTKLLLLFAANIATILPWKMKIMVDGSFNPLVLKTYSNFSDEMKWNYRRLTSKYNCPNDKYAVLIWKLNLFLLFLTILLHTTNLCSDTLCE